MADENLGEALKWIGALFGGGGLTAIAVAWLGTKRPRPAEPSATAGPMAGIGALLADHYSIDRMTNEMRRLADANERLANGIHRYCDLMDITQALGRLQHGAFPPPAPKATD